MRQWHGARPCGRVAPVAVVVGGGGNGGVQAGGQEEENKPG